MQKISTKKLLQISCTTNILEWYEFTIYAFLAVLMGKLFFGATTSSAAAILSFSLFAVSYLIRPIGSLFWGYIGDKYGSGFSLKYSMLLMSFPTFLIGLLPTYSTCGYYAAVLLIILRLIQGFAAGGELPTSATYMYQCSSHLKNRNLFCSLVNVGGMIGVLLGSLFAFLLTVYFPSGVIQDWAWRIPFILGLPITLIIFKIRKNIILDKLDKAKSNAGILLGNMNALKFLKAFIIISFLQVSFYILFVWMPTYLEVVLEVPHYYAKLSNTISLILLVVFTIFFGYIGSYVSYKKLIMLSTVSTIILMYPLFTLLSNPDIYILIAVHIVFVIIMSPIQSTYIFALGDLFRNNALNRSMALSFTIPTALFGGTAPVICNYFINLLNYNLFPSFYLMIFGVIAVPAIYLL